MDSTARALYYLLTFAMLADLAFLHCGNSPRCMARIDKRFDGYHTLQFCAGGAVEVIYDNRATTLKGRWFWTAYPGPRIAFHPARGHQFWVHRYVAFTGPLVGRWVREGLYPMGPVEATDARAYCRYEARFDAMLASIRRGDRLGNLRAVNMLEGILIDLTESGRTPRSAMPSSEHTWLADATAVMSDVGSGTPDYAEMAKQAAMGLSTFRRRFKLATGLSPHVYTLRARAARARELLGETDLPIKAIAHRLGYRDVFFFTRQFKRLIGVTPGEYRHSRQV